MNNQVLPVGSRVRVISYSPFRGLIGTIRTVDTIPDLEADEAFCFYLVELEGTHSKDAIWFECDEVELVSPLGGTLSNACRAGGYPIQVHYGKKAETIGQADLFRTVQVVYYL